MKRGGDGSAGLVLGAAIAALWLWSGNSAAATVDAPANPNAADDSFDTSWDSPMTQDQINSANVEAFLYMIRCCENSQATDDDRYFRFYGNTSFRGIADHPAITGECKPVPLDSLGSRYKGLVSTAAGAYQIIVPTWGRPGGAGIRAAGALGAYIPDFSPSSQDEAARRLLINNGAMALILSGDIEGAINSASSLWASLPGSTAQQNPQSMQIAMGYFNEALA